MTTARRAAIAAASAALVCAAPAQAVPDQPAPPPPPPTPKNEFIPPPSGIGNVLAQRGDQPGGLLGLPDLSAYGPNLLLGQNPEPVAAGAPSGTPAIPNLSAFNPAYLLIQNQVPAAPGEGIAAPGLAPDRDIPGTGRIDFLRRVYEMYQAGALKGSLLGQQSPEEFAEEALAPPPPSG